ncbi:DUF1997 domain-containing protein [Planktothrix paucivesiculata]|uniref:DUF1997 domain-containing protein n=1 Tax=Planktothrix paucivesiculata PCC 9631 TaxID=671071 RepID=A0A7Z9E1C2_9CYAN|nr:DUF1997 domain-containing protein [Planktothrix paucivesiculata]VXD22644.1 conserved hypothetical protein [Planktothrix paucivesiculata PCC 9631]
MYTHFQASQTVEMAIPEPTLIHHYLRQPKRLVKALVDPTRLDALTEDIYRLKMRPLQFMMFSLQPTVDLKLWIQSDGTLNLKSVGCEIRGIEYINQRFALNLVGKLYPVELQGITHLKGQADLQVKVELPPPLWLTPQAILETTGNGLLKSVLMTVKHRLVHNLLSDYAHWSAEQLGALVPQPQSIIQVSNAEC